jgi:ABC-type dipeptide/oligopeptide/nickel transport system permease subunit
MKTPASLPSPTIDDNLPPPAWGGLLGDSLRRLLRSKPAVLSLAVILAFLAAGVFAPVLAPYDPYQMGWGHDGLPPAWVQSGVKVGELQHPLGTDSVGRDVLSRLLYGTRTALSMALPGAAIAALLGTLVGLAAGFFGGRTDRLLMQVSDIFNAFPTIMFSVLLVLIFRRTAFGNWQNGLLTVALSFALAAWAPLARLARAAVLKVRQELYVEAALSVGIPSGRLLFRHILPNISSIIIVWLTTAIPRVIILEALLGYIGIRITAAAGDGAEAYVVSWGGMFFDGRLTLRSNPTLLVAPSVCVILVAVAFTLLGDRLRDAMDTRLRDLM